jgi:hypothetical protein
MQSLKNTKLSDTNLRLKANSAIREIDSPIPMNIKELKDSNNLETHQIIEGIDLRYIKHINNL